jgi:hypothetical protein
MPASRGRTVTILDLQARAPARWIVEFELPVSGKGAVARDA